MQIHARPVRPSCRCPLQRLVRQLRRRDPRPPRPRDAAPRSLRTDDDDQRPLIFSRHCFLDHVHRDPPCAPRRHDQEHHRRASSEPAGGPRRSHRRSRFPAVSRRRPRSRTRSVTPAPPPAIGPPARLSRPPKEDRLCCRTPWRSAAARSGVRCNAWLGSALRVPATWRAGRGSVPPSSEVLGAVESVPVGTPSGLKQYLDLRGHPFIAPDADQVEFRRHR
jgi:hypothetical protein